VDPPERSQLAPSQRIIGPRRRVRTAVNKLQFARTATRRGLIVCHYDHRRAVFVRKRAQEIKDLSRRVAVQISCRLVSKDDRRPRTNARAIATRASVPPESSQGDAHHGRRAQPFEQLLSAALPIGPAFRRARAATTRSGLAVSIGTRLKN